MILRATLLLLITTAVAHAQSALDGTSFQGSLYNMPGDVGFVRLIDQPGSECRVEGGTDVEDKPGDDVCLIQDSGIAPVTLTFGAGPQPIGGALINSTVTTFEGLPAGSISAFNPLGFDDEGNTAPLDWSVAGDLIEWTIRTADDSFLARDEIEGADDFWGFSATGIQYPNAAADSQVVIPYDEELGNNVNFYFWFETADGPITSGYEVRLPVGLGSGRHPLDPDREVLYPLYSNDQADEQTDTVAGGSLDFYSHGSVLDASPQIGNILFLAENTVSVEALDDPYQVTGIGFAVLVVPPELETTGLIGDFDGDELLTAADIDLLSAAVGGGDITFDLDADGAVNEADRVVWTGLAGTLFGDADLNGTVEFADFLALSSAFGTAGGWADGDFDGSGDVQFADFLQLSANFGSTAAAASSVPEPTSSWMLCLGLLGLLSAARQRR